MKDPTVKKLIKEIVTQEIFGLGKKKEERVVMSQHPLITNIVKKFNAGKRYFVLIPMGDTIKYMMVDRPDASELMDKIGTRPHITFDIRKLLGNITPPSQ